MLATLKQSKCVFCASPFATHACILKIPSLCLSLETINTRCSQTRIHVNFWFVAGGDNFLGMKSTKSGLVSISILKRPNREYIISMLERIINTRSPTLTKWHWPGSECRRPVCPPWARQRRWPARQPRCWSPLWSGVRSSCRCLLSAPPAKSRGRTSEIGGKW